MPTLLNFTGPTGPSVERFRVMMTTTKTCSLFRPQESRAHRLRSSSLGNLGHEWILRVPKNLSLHSPPAMKRNLPQLRIKSKSRKNRHPRRRSANPHSLPSSIQWLRILRGCRSRPTISPCLDLSSGGITLLRVTMNVLNIPNTPSYLGGYLGGSNPSVARCDSRTTPSCVSTRMPWGGYYRGEGVRVDLGGEWCGSLFCSV